MKFFIVFVLLISLFFPTKALAKINLSFSPPPTTLQSTEVFPLTVTIDGATETSEYYIRGAFFLANTTQYVGATQNNNSEWITSSNDHTQYFKIIGNQSTTIYFHPNLGEVLQEDTPYLFKVGRYTSGGSLTWSEQTPAEVLIQASPSPSPSVSPSPSPSASLSPTSTPIAIDPSNIDLSEVMACPPTGEKEWVEIHNNNAFDVTLNNWFLKDNSTNKHQFTSSIPSNGYAVIEVTSMFNNDGDSVRLLNSKEEIIGQMSYTDCDSTHTWIKELSNWQQTRTITKGSVNIFSPILNTPTPSNSVSTPFPPTPTSQPTYLPSPQPSTVTIESSSSSATLSGLILGSSIEKEDATISTESGFVNKNNSDLSTKIALFTLIGGGGLFLSVGVYGLSEWYNHRHTS